MAKSFNEAITEIMPLVKSGLDLPFVISHEDGNWNINYFALNPTATPEEIKVQGAEYLALLREKDPYITAHTGADFSNGSFPHVYDAVLCDRIRAEYNVARSSGKDTDSLHAVTCFFNDNVASFSHEVTDYLTTLDRPLAALAEMFPSDLSIDPSGYGYTLDDDLVEDVIDQIENAVSDRLHILEEKSVPQKRSINGYEEMYSIQINGRLLFIGENPNAEHRYMVTEERWDNALGLRENEYTGVTSDFLEAIGEYTKNVQYYINCANSDRLVRKELHGVEPIVLTAADCVPNGLLEDLEGKLIVIKSEVLTPEKQTSDYQLKICKGGFGAAPNSRGNAVFCADLYSGKESRFERYDVLGVMDVAKLPEWAKVKLAELEKPPVKQQAKTITPPKDTRSEEKPQKKPSLLGELNAAIAEAAQIAERKGGNHTKKRGDMEVD